MAEYKVGERLRLACDVTVNECPDLTGVLVCSLDGGPSIEIPLDRDDVSITRLVPAEGMPQPGELWQDAHGLRLLVCKGNRWDGEELYLTDGKNHLDLAEILRRGPMTPIWRHPAPEPEPETVSIRAVPFGTLVTSHLAPGVELVRITGVEDTDDPETVRVAYRVVTDDTTGPERHVLTPADLRVTIVQDGGE